MLPIKALLFSSFVAIVVVAHAADSSVRQDVLFAKIRTLLEAEKPAEALPYFLQLEAMESSLSNPLPESFHFHYVSTLDKTGDKAKALSRANVYVTTFGRKGAHYEKVIEIIGRLEMEIDREAKARSEASRRADQKGKDLADRKAAYAEQMKDWEEKMQACDDKMEKKRARLNIELNVDDPGSYQRLKDHMRLSKSGYGYASFGDWDRVCERSNPKPREPR